MIPTEQVLHNASNDRGGSARFRRHTVPDLRVQLKGGFGAFADREQARREERVAIDAQAAVTAQAARDAVTGLMPAGVVPTSVAAAVPTRAPAAPADEHA